MSSRLYQLLDYFMGGRSDQKKKELLIEFGDENKSPPEIIEKVLEMRADGIQMRLLICEGDTQIMGPLEEYRYIPKNKFSNYVSLIYADKVAVSTKNQLQALVIKDENLALTRKNMFEIVWELLEQPQKSTSKTRYK